MSWNCPDWAHGLWYQKLTKSHGRIAVNSIKYWKKAASEWLIVGRTTLIIKDAINEGVASNYMPIACLLLTCLPIATEKMYDHFLQNPLLLDKKEGCRKESRDTKDPLLVCKAILWNCERMCKGNAIGWTDYKNVHDIVPHLRLKEAVEL